jgi:hypothetical protein
VWGYVKDEVLVPPLPASLEELQARMTEAVATIGADMFHWIWDEIALQMGHLPRDTRKPHSTTCEYLQIKLKNIYCIL